MFPVFRKNIPTHVEETSGILCTHTHIHTWGGKKERQKETDRYTERILKSPTLRKKLRRALHIVFGSFVYVYSISK